MRPYHLFVHLVLAICNQNAFANHFNATESSRSATVASIGDTLAATTPADGWFSFDMKQPTVLTVSVVARNNRALRFLSEFAKVELHMGNLHGSGLIELTGSPTALRADDGTSATASPRCTATVQSAPESLREVNQSSISRLNNTTSLAALPTPTGLFNTTNFNISRLSTFAAPALQSFSGGPVGKSSASSYRAVAAAAASLYFVVFS